MVLILGLLFGNLGAAPTASPVTAPPEPIEAILFNMASMTPPDGTFNGMGLNSLAAIAAAGNRRTFPNKTTFEAVQLGGQIEAYANSARTIYGYSFAINGDAWVAPYWWGWFESPRWGGRVAGKTIQGEALAFGIAKEAEQESLIATWTNAPSGGGCLFLIEQNEGACAQSRTGLVSLEIPSGTGHILLYIWTLSGADYTYVIGELFSNPTAIAATKSRLNLGSIPVPNELPIPAELRVLLNK